MPARPCVAGLRRVTGMHRARVGVRSGGNAAPGGDAAVNIGEPRRIIEVEPVTLPVPEVLPDAMPEPARPERAPEHAPEHAPSEPGPAR